MAQAKVTSGRNNLLHIDTKFEYEIDKINENDCGCIVSKNKVTSGKFTKYSINIVKQEIWLHIAVSKRYTKRVSFDSLDFEAFIAGETKIIYSRMCDESNWSEAMGRLNVLTLTAHWLCKTRN